MMGVYFYAIVDEIHERFMDAELLNCLLKGALESKTRLKLVIMSVTLKAKLFTDYFVDSRVVAIDDIENHHVKKCISGSF